MARVMPTSVWGRPKIERVQPPPESKEKAMAKEIASLKQQLADMKRAESVQVVGLKQQLADMKWKESTHVIDLKQQIKQMKEKTIFPADKAKLTTVEIVRARYSLATLLLMSLKQFCGLPEKGGGIFGGFATLMQMMSIGIIPERVEGDIDLFLGQRLSRDTIRDVSKRLEEIEKSFVALQFLQGVTGQLGHQFGSYRLTSVEMKMKAFPAEMKEQTQFDGYRFRTRVVEVDGPPPFVHMKLGFASPIDKVSVDIIACRDTEELCDFAAKSFSITQDGVHSESDYMLTMFQLSMGCSRLSKKLVWGRSDVHFNDTFQLLKKYPIRLERLSAMGMKPCGFVSVYREDAKTGLHIGVVCGCIREKPICSACKDICKERCKGTHCDCVSFCQDRHSCEFVSFSEMSESIKAGSHDAVSCHKCREGYRIAYSLVQEPGMKKMDLTFCSDSPLASLMDLFDMAIKGEDPLQELREAQKERDLRVPRRVLPVLPDRLRKRLGGVPVVPSDSHHVPRRRGGAAARPAPRGPAVRPAAPTFGVPGRFGALSGR
ncbi:MAG: hypothetical protein Edafosvirus44_4 [Edafosvirus sp.]|uniref:Uncharacterized protein n=1 Tax=Edafosvirus sp. TaxID=2487765 RepID=A0A3G4ZZV9_9VIRU|nr:MAG: hypothetical protein Edafosvirus44_4 [Edafosvirus sp.]